MLVIDTTNFTTKSSFEGESDNLHRVGHPVSSVSPRRVVERLARSGPDTLLYQFTVDDSSTFTRPFSGELTMRRTAERLNGDINESASASV